MNGRAVLPPLPPVPAPARARVVFGKVAGGTGHRVLLYGPGGIGKTTLAAQAPGQVVFFDLDDSLPRLRLTGEPAVVTGVQTWADLRAALQSDGWDEVKTVVIDSLTRAEDMCVAHTLATVPHEHGNKVERLEDYGYGKGYQHVFETFLLLLSDLDRHCRAGRHVVLICHDCTANVPNPAGADWLRYEPRLQSANGGKASVRLRVREWADHVLFIGYDVNVTKDGKGRGAGTRTVYPSELPHCMAKSRTCQQPMPLANGAELWATIIEGGN